MPKQQLRTVLVPLFLSFVSIILIAIIFVGGSRPHFLTDFYFFETETSDVKVPSSLNSSFLRGLQTITGTKLTGEEANATSLGLSKEYRVALINACARNGSDAICGDAKIGFHFDTIKNLSLATNGQRGQIPDDVYDQLKIYKSVSPFLAGTYIAAGGLLILSPILLACLRSHPRSAIICGTAALGGFVFLLIASAAAIAGFIKLVDTLNKAFESKGYKSKVGIPIFVVSWVATFLALAASLIMISGARANKRRQRAIGGDASRMRPTFLGKLDTTPRGGVDVAGADGMGPGRRTTAMTPISAFMKRVPTWNRHKYTQVERQQAVQPQVEKQRGSAEDDRELLVKGDNQHPTIDELEEEQGYSIAAPRGIALHTLPGRTTRDADTVYEPYR